MRSPRLRRRLRAAAVEPAVLPADQAARLAAWVAELDIDLGRAQVVLRLPPDEMPPAPGAPKLRGAYARRART